jgi:hypothetical protein
MKRTIARLSLALLAALPLALPAHALALGEFDRYALSSVSAGLSTGQAAGHADLTIDFALAESEGEPFGLTRDLEFRLPPGVFGNPEALAKCTTLQLGGSTAESSCPIASQVGYTEVTLGGANAGTFTDPIYNMPAPGGDKAARLGFFAGPYPMTAEVRLDPATEELVTTVEGAPAAASVISARNVLWGVPSAAVHDPFRITPEEALKRNGPPGGRAVERSEVPFMTNPSSCGPPGRLTVTATSYQLPGSPSTLSAPFPQITGCGLLKFRPEISIAPTTAQASSGSGLGVGIDFATEGLRHGNLLGDSNLRRAVVTLPKGMTINPSQAEGLGVCSEADFARETYERVPNQGCPESAKIGTVTATTPVLSEAAEGSLYVAKPYRNPYGTLIALYMTLKIPARGVLVGLAGKVEPDPATGQLITTFGDPGQEIPDLPVSSFRLHFREGARSPLITPPACGSYAADATFYSWGGQEVVSHPSFEIESGPGHGACPRGPAPFSPGFEAGSLNNAAGSYSPFDMRITRADGEQDITRFSSVLPPGVVARLAGTSWCPESGIARAKSRTGENGGTDERNDPSCPADSKIGATIAGAGVGSQLTYVPGSLYLAGPYNGAPLSVVAITPAVAGPFDAGTVVVREALTLNPVTGVAEVDGAASDPIPHILKGIPLNLRELQVHVDKPRFTLNATSCEEEQAKATLWGGGTALAPMTDFPVGLSSRYQAASCASLAFKPRLAIRLYGGTRRGAHPALRAIVRPRPGQANFRRAAVTLPSSAFLEQAHIRTVCTRVQFAAGGGHGEHCPRGAVYGRAKAWSPLIEGPATGPVYLRSSNHKLPDLVVALKGPPSAPVDVELASRIDSVKIGRGAVGIRSVFSAIPDIPVSRFVLAMRGGKKGLIVNSRHLCYKPKRNKARANLAGQNGRVEKLKPRVVSVKCAKRRKKARRKHKKAHGSHARAARVSRASTAG